ncbi:MAG: hypothetical protein JO197_15880 [Acidobacteria bacterium]|nr:hypothetical protein [Acidobacteriota bacterium]MBV9474997.1 hypothetical protein [Acidobacteriota bacterium]
MRIPTALLALLFAASLHAQAHAPLTSDKDLIIPRTSANRIVIPIAGSTPGGNGTFFRSDITVINFRAAEQRVELRWLPLGTSGAGIAPVTITVPAQSGFFSEDFVTNILQQSGLGAIDVRAVDANGELDPNAALHATARIWTPEPQVTNGTMSQTFPAIVPVTTNGLLRWIFGVRRNEQYRMNAGITNLSDTTQRFRVTTIGSTPAGAGETTEVEVAAQSVSQFGLTGTATGSFQVVVQNISDAPSPNFITWASSIDNVTGDAWSQMGFPAPPQPQP